MTTIDVSAAVEIAAPRIIKRAPMGTNPLELTQSEKKLLAAINLEFNGNAAEVDRHIAKTTASEKITKHRQMRKVGFLNVPSAPIIPPIRLFYVAIVGIEAPLSNNMSAAKIGRASRRERVYQYESITVDAVSVKTKITRDNKKNKE